MWRYEASKLLPKVRIFARTYQFGATDMTNTLFIGKVYHRFKVLTSTNDWLKTEAAKNKPPEGMVVRADSQSAGRGQFGSRWESETGANLTLSVLLYPNWLPAGQQFYLSMAMALGVREAVEKILAAAPQTPLPAVRIKWPNDLYIDDRKVGGILIENTLAGASLQTSVAGIGLNVNQIAFPADLPNPGSLALAMQRNFDADEMAECLFECLERRYLQLKANRKANLKSDYLAALYRLDTPAFFQKTTDATVFEGRISGVSEEGLLQISMADGQAAFFDLKQIRFLI